MKYILLLVFFTIPINNYGLEYKYGIIIESEIKIKSAPEVSANSIDIVRYLERVECIEKSPNEIKIGKDSFYWYKIVTVKGQKGWIYGKSINLFKEKPESLTYYAKVLQKKLNLSQVLDIEGLIHAESGKHKYNIRFNEIAGLVSVSHEFDRGYFSEENELIYEFNGKNLNLVIAHNKLASCIRFKNYLIVYGSMIITNLDHDIYIDVYDTSKKIKNIIVESPSPDSIYSNTFSITFSEMRDKKSFLELDESNLILTIRHRNSPHSVKKFRFENGKFISF